MTTETINGVVNVVPDGGVSADAKKRKLDEESSAAVAVPPASHLLIKRLSDKARLPTRGSPYSAGYDLYRYSISAFFYLFVCFRALWFIFPIPRLIFTPSYRRANLQGWPRSERGRGQEVRAKRDVQ